VSLNYLFALRQQMFSLVQRFRVQDLYFGTKLVLLAIWIIKNVLLCTEISELRERSDRLVLPTSLVKGRGALMLLVCLLVQSFKLKKSLPREEPCSND